MIEISTQHVISWPQDLRFQSVERVSVQCWCESTKAILNETENSGSDASIPSLVMRGMSRYSAPYIFASVFVPCGAIICAQEITREHPRASPNCLSGCRPSQRDR